MWWHHEGCSAPTLPLLVYVTTTAADVCCGSSQVPLVDVTMVPGLCLAFAVFMLSGGSVGGSAARVSHRGTEFHEVTS